MATLADIAKALGVNKTTVSKALNNSSDIKQETSELICAEAERVGYTKHKIKQASRSEFIGIICPEVSSYYYAQVTTFLSARLEEKGYSTLLMLSNFSPETEARLFSRLISLNVAGIIVITEQTDLGPALRKIPGADKVPIVVIGLNYESADHDVVSIDERRGIRAITQHLSEKGHRRVGFIGDSLVNNRLAYFQESAAENGLELPDECVILSDKRNEECGYEGMRRILALSEHPTAVLAGYDTIALGAYRALSELGLRVPEDIALVGFDDAHFCSYLPCSMTSVNYDVAAECKVATAILLSRIRDRDSQSTQTAAIIPRLVVRESTSGARQPSAEKKQNLGSPKTS